MRKSIVDGPWTMADFTAFPPILEPRPKTEIKAAAYCRYNARPGIFIGSYGKVPRIRQVIDTVFEIVFTKMDG